MADRVEEAYPWVVSDPDCGTSYAPHPLGGVESDPYCMNDNHGHPSVLVESGPVRDSGHLLRFNKRQVR